MLAGKIARLIRENGPLPFSRFMDLALYDEDGGYYRRDPFGKHGDFYTASQLQPVFGAYVKLLSEQLLPGFGHFVDIGAGREDLADTFTGRYLSVRHGEAIPKTYRSILFANELIDAMPVDLVEGEVTLAVALAAENFCWHPHEPRDGVQEVRSAVGPHLEQAWRSLDEGFYVLIDYGYRARDAARFPRGSLMSYRKHVASSRDVLSEPGSRDLTAHVDWDALLLAASAVGWKTKSFSTLRDSLLSLGPTALESLYSLDRMQLRTLLFGFGEFDVVVLEKNESPGCPGLC